MRSVKAESAEQQEWIPVEDCLPPHGKAVLVVIGGYTQHLPALRIHTENGEWWEWIIEDEYDKAPISAVTHWMPLPEPPKVRRREP